MLMAYLITIVNQAIQTIIGKIIARELNWIRS